MNALYLPCLFLLHCYLEKEYKENLEMMHHGLEDIITETKNYGIDMEIQVQQADSLIVEKIAGVGKKNNVELIVLISTGKSKIARILVRNVAQ